MVFEMFFANWDWPHNNVRYWKERKPNAKWRWIFFDCDACMMRSNINSISEFVEGNPDESWITRQFGSLMESQEFRSHFYSRFLELLNTSLRTDLLIHQLDSFQTVIEPVIIEQIHRWHKPVSLDHWQENNRLSRNFILTRPINLNNHIKEQLGNPFSIYPNPSAGEINITMETGIDLIQSVTVYGMNAFDKIDSKTVRTFVNPNQKGIQLVEIQYRDMIYFSPVLFVR